MRLFLGVDGGQSSTTALIGDEHGRVLGAGRGGPCNHVKSGDGRQKFVSALTGCLQLAAQAAGLAPDHLQFTAACLGMSGGPSDKQQLIESMIRSESYFVTHDALIALSGATAGQPGVIVISGTGSIAFARNAAAKLARAGGWGYIFGDEGGGFDIARQALRATLQMEEGWGEPTLLRELLLEWCGAKTANDALHLFYTVDYPRHRVAKFAQVVDEAAQMGDAAAIGILERAAQQLASLAASARHQVFNETETARVSPIGGVFRSQLLEHRFRMLIELGAPSIYGPPLHGPAAGALIEAYRLAGLNVILTEVPMEKEG